VIGQSSRPAWERWLVIAVIVAIVVGIAIGVWLYSAVAAG
jgi:hypothetical protein